MQERLLWTAAQQWNTNLQRITKHWPKTQQGCKIIDKVWAADLGRSRQLWNGQMSNGQISTSWHGWESMPPIHQPANQYLLNARKKCDTRSWYLIANQLQLCCILLMLIINMYYFLPFCSLGYCCYCGRYYFAWSSVFLWLQARRKLHSFSKFLNCVSNTYPEHRYHIQLSNGSQ